MEHMGSGHIVNQEGIQGLLNSCGISLIMIPVTFRSPETDWLRISQVCIRFF